MPARTPAKETIALSVLLVVLVAVVVFQFRNMGAAGAGRPPAQARPESSRVAAARDRAAAVPELRLSALKALAATPDPTIGRNPFRERPVPPPVPVGRSGPGQTAAFVGPVPPPPPPPPPPITLKLVGIVRGSGQPIAALTDGRDVFYGREGDVLEGRYKILKINVESIDISYVDGRGQRRIGLTG
jgi:hypothetical protein